MEAAGLALGGVALAGLFSSCIDVLEYLETGRTWARDIHITLTKLSFLKQRLREWGAAVSIHTHPSEKQSLPNASREEKGLIADSLLGIQQLLAATSRLCSKHGCVRDSQRQGIGHDGVCWDGWSVKAGSIDSRNEEGSRLPETVVDTAKSCARWRTLRLRVAWAVSDKKRFDALIGELEFLVSNLERLGQTEEMDSSSRDSSPEPERLDLKPTPSIPFRVVSERRDSSNRSAGRGKKTSAALQRELNWRKATEPIIDQRAMVLFQNAPKSDERVHADKDRGHEQRTKEAKSSSSKNEEKARSHVSNNICDDDSEQINTSSETGPNVFGNQSLGQSAQANGEVSKEAQVAMFSNRSRKAK